MPNIPLNTRETSSFSRTYPMCHENFPVHMSEEEKIAAEESLKAYGKPIELYNTLPHRAKKNPLFLQRSLNYQIEANHQRRIQMTLSLLDTIDAGVQTQTPFPLYVLLARLISPKHTTERSAVYKFSRACTLTEFQGVDGVSQTQAKFSLPDMNELALEAKSGLVAILFISFARAQISQFGICSSNIPPGYSQWSKIPLESLYSSWQKYPNMDLGQKANSVSLVQMEPCFLQLTSTNEEKCVAIQVPSNPLTYEEKCVAIQVPSNPLTSSSPQQIKVTISAEVVISPYSYSLSLNDIPSSSMLEITRLRAGNVIFNYIYHNNKLQKTEVTEDFTCPICLVKCASFKGLQSHMPSSHDLFNFEFWVNEEYQVVDVSLKSETMITEINEDDLNARLEFFFSTKKSRRKRQKSQVGNSRQRPRCVVLDKTDDNFGLFRNSNRPSSSESHT